MSQIPRFAFVGPVNPGKTSVIAALVEDDRLRISAVPGETTECQHFAVTVGGREVIGFFDTPGFQNARETLAKLREFSSETAEPLKAFRKFVSEFASNPDYAEECKLFRPILEGAGIVYVVDAAQKIRPINEAEMEILRMTGQPRLGLINSTADPVHKQAWKNRLSLHFGLVREFNAHTASYRDRISLIESLGLIEQSWQPAIQAAMAAIRADWEKRARECAGTICELIADCLTYQEVANLGEHADEEAEKRVLAEKYQDSIRAMERAAHQQIIAIFRHHRVKLEERNAPRLEQDLFSEKTWQVFGLNRQQLTLAGAAAGAAAGGALELVLLGHGFGIPTVLGTTLGAGGAAASAFFGGERLTKVRVPISRAIKTLLGWSGELGGTQIRVGPNQALNFPWILIDRALTVFYYVTHRTHARQDGGTIEPEALMPTLQSEKVLSTKWDEATRKACEKSFVAIRKNKGARQEIQRLAELLAHRLQTINGNA